MTTYTEHDFARAEFAQHPARGYIAMRVPREGRGAWINSQGGELDDFDMVAKGWTPVPADSSARTDESPDLMDGGVTSALVEREAEQAGGPLGETVDFWRARWKEAADRADARDLAAHQWKKATREHVSRARTAKAYAERLKTAVPVLRALAEKAEQERDEARATKNMHKERAERERARADAAEQPRPLTPDAITDEMRGRARKAAAARMPGAWWGGSEWWGYADEILRAALTEPPTRPEGAEAFDPIIDAAIRGHSDITSPDVVHAIADALADEGVRAPGAES